eukprot:1483226-Rhodomonas_salina.1
MPGPGLAYFAYGATSCYAMSVLRQHMLPHVCYAMSGTEITYAATRRSGWATGGTLCYLPTRLLCDVRY